MFYHDLGKQADDSPDEQEATSYLQCCSQWICSHNAEERMNNFEDGERLSEGEERVEGLVKAIELVVSEENGNKEDGSEGDDGPERNVDSVVGEKVVLPGQKRFRRAGIGISLGISLGISRVFHGCDVVVGGLSAC